jgi:hypothetical protein
VTAAAPPAPGTSRAAHLAQVAALLWPPPAAVRIGRPEQPDGDFYLLVPSAQQPRLVLPRNGRAAAAAVAGFNPDRSRRAAAVSGLLRAALRTGTARALMRDQLVITGAGPNLRDYLGEVLGQDVLISLLLGPARANAKPIAQVLTPAGEVLGYAKVGGTDLSRRLVRAETSALELLAAARTQTIEIPRILHAGRWRDAEILVLSPLRASGKPPRRGAGRLLQDAVAEVIAITGTRRTELAASAYWQRLQDRLRLLGDRGTGFAEVAEQIGAAAGSAELTFGSWHGDWTRSNVTVRAASVLAWDWERFESGVPAGFDALHYRLHQAINTERAEPAAAVRATFAAAPGLLARFSTQPELTCALYHLELAVRYLQDRQDLAGARLGHPDAWMLPSLISAVETLS